MTITSSIVRRLGMKPPGQGRRASRRERLRLATCQSPGGQPCHTPYYVTPRHNSYVPFQRDPVSELFDAGARQLLARAYAKPGTWQATRLANPSPRHLAYLSSLGIDPHGRDDKSGSGRLNARTRWARGFVRALYYQHKWWSGSPTGGTWRAERRPEPRGDRSLVVEVGRALPGGRQAGSVLHPGRAVRVKVVSGGRAHVRSSADLSFTLDGRGQSDARARDWE